MRTLLIGALIAALVGCCRTPQQAMLERCTSKGCIQKTAAHPQVTLKPMAFRFGLATANAKPIAAPTGAPEPASAEPTDQTGLIDKAANSPISSMPAAAVSDQSAETSDTVLKRAKATTAAMLADPASAEFDDMKRAVRKDISGQPVDAICGHVKEKKGPSDRPFVYLVKEDKAYIDDGYPESVATTWYRAVCTDADAPRQASRQPPSK